MDDLISRQAALDAIRNITEVYINNLPTLIDKASVQTELMMLPSEHPELDEWCDDCKEYDQERHCCPRFNRVIKTTLEEAKLRKKWKWIEDAETFYKAVNEKGGGVDADTPYFTEDDIACSECLTLFSTIDNCTEGFDFCPACGADMRGEQE